MNEEEIARILGKGFSAGTESFRDDLLKRCLAALDAEDEARVVPDDELELLAAAGDPFKCFERVRDDN